MQTTLSPKALFVIIIFFCCVPSCRETELERTLQELDHELELQEDYIREFDNNTTTLKLKCLSESSDSLRWVIAHEIVNRYSFSNLDSMIRYVELEKRLAINDSQRLYSDFDDIFEMSGRGDKHRAYQKYLSINKEVFSGSDSLKYLYLGYDIFKHDENFREQFDQVSKQLRQCDSSSYIGIRNLVYYDERNGEETKSIERFLVFLEKHPGSKEESSALMALGQLYGRLGDREKMERYYALSSISDIRKVHRNFRSLYLLANLRLEDRDFDRASKYIAAHYKTMSEGYFYPRLMMSGSAVSKISSEYIAAQKRIRWIIIQGGSLVLVLALILFLLFRRFRKKSKSLEVANNNLIDAQHKLAITNQIKENYVSRYMTLSRRYLDESVRQRLEFKRILKDSGPDELFRKLKQVDREYIVEKEFYRIFDEAFLDIFPDFVHQVNSLIKPEFAFDENARSLPTEIRILAVIRLGITSSPDIATFLNCSLNTVYTYRGKIRNLSRVGKGEIEEIIARIN